MSTSTSPIDIPAGVGSRGPLRLLFLSGEQNGYQYLAGVIPVATLLDIVELPDPSKPLEDNRIVSESRCKAFADYVLADTDPAYDVGWTCPPIMVRVDPHQLDEMKTTHDFGDGTKLVEVTIPKSLLLRILDGQHRCLGFHLARRRCSEEIDRYAQLLSNSERTGEPPQATDKLRQLLDKWKAKQKMVVDAAVMVEIAVVDRAMGRQMFVDIADNAMGVNPDYTKVLDQREAANRIAIELIEKHPLLKGRTEIGQAKRMSRANTNLIGAKSVTDIVKAIFAGTGRVGTRLNEELSNHQSVKTKEVSDFFDGLVASFGALQEVVDGVLDPVQLREGSLLGSATMLRVLAITWHDLLAKGMATGDIEAFFKKLDPHMSFREFAQRDDDGNVVKDDQGDPVKLMGVDPADKLWWPTGVFPSPGAKAPGARQGNIKSLADSLVGWATKGHPAL